MMRPPLRIDIPFRRTHQPKIKSGSRSPVCPDCDDCECFEDRIFLLTSWDIETGRAVCLECTRAASTHPEDVLDYYSPFLCHCMDPEYAACSRCRRSLVHLATHDEIGRERKIASIPCRESFDWRWALGRDRTGDAHAFCLDFDPRYHTEIHDALLEPDKRLRDQLPLILEYVGSSFHEILEQARVNADEIGIHAHLWRDMCVIALKRRPKRVLDVPPRQTVGRKSGRLMEYAEEANEDREEIKQEEQEERGADDDSAGVDPVRQKSEKRRTSQSRDQEMSLSIEEVKAEKKDDKETDPENDGTGDDGDDDDDDDSAGWEALQKIDEERRASRGRNKGSWAEMMTDGKLQTFRIWKYSGVSRADLLRYLPPRIATEIHVFDESGAHIGELVKFNPNVASGKER